MLNKERHQLIMGQILKDLYTDVSISSLLGFKGGTAAYFFYALPRFSVDLDFDLIDPSKENQELIFTQIKKILGKYGSTKDSYIKKNTIFFLLSYGDKDHNVKIEISTRQLLFVIKEKYILSEYLGIAMFVAKKEYLFATKLAALTLRTDMAMRDVYDIYFFANNNWDIDHEVVRAWTNKSTKKHLADCINVVEKINENQTLKGLGELLDEKQKAWVKKSLKAEALFMLRNYLSIQK